jgi:hypothetical protein
MVVPVFSACASALGGRSAGKRDASGAVEEIGQERGPALGGKALAHPVQLVPDAEDVHHHEEAEAAGAGRAPDRHGAVRGGDREALSRHSDSPAGP